MSFPHTHILANGGLIMIPYFGVRTYRLGVLHVPSIIVEPPNHKATPFLIFTDLILYKASDYQ